jgi:hypothetical protein
VGLIDDDERDGAERGQGTQGVAEVLDLEALRCDVAEQRLSLGNQL